MRRYVRVVIAAASNFVPTLCMDTMHHVHSFQTYWIDTREYLEFTTNTVVIHEYDKAFLIIAGLLVIGVTV